MTHRCLVFVAASCMIASVGLGARPQQSEPASPNQQSKLLTVSGCVVPDRTRPGKYALSDAEQAADYRLTGMNVRDYVGKRVEMSGSTPKGLKITGGLYPSPNVAAQGGADRNKAAIAATQPNATGSKPMSEFRVRSVRAIPGACPEQ